LGSSRFDARGAGACVSCGGKVFLIRPSSGIGASGTRGNRRALSCVSSIGASASNDGRLAATPSTLACRNTDAATASAILEFACHDCF
jgi:hypothetical protein